MISMQLGHLVYLPLETSFGDGGFAWHSAQSHVPTIDISSKRPRKSGPRNVSFSSAVTGAGSLERPAKKARNELAHWIG